MRTPSAVLSLGAATVVILAAGSTVAAAAVSGGLRHAPTGDSSTAACAVPELPGTVVDVTLVDMGGMMRGGSMGGARGGSQGRMALLASPAAVPAGTVSFRVHNAGALTHEMVVLRSVEGDHLGGRAVGRDARIDEAGSLGEASRTCGPSTGEGIAAGATGWVTLTLHSGSVELVCNFAGHYGQGMYAPLAVRR